MADKKENKKNKKKDRQLIIRVSAEERAAFLAACESRDTSAAQQIRRFMRRYVETQGSPGGSKRT